MSTLSTQPTDIDESLYSRQLYVLGHEAMKKMSTSTILVIGLRGLGVEIAKNLILGGVKSVTLYDNNITTIADLGSQFYLTEKEIGKPRAESCISELMDLNRNVHVKLLNNKIDEVTLKDVGYTLVIVTNETLDIQIKINNWCRLLNIGFIAADTFGVVCSTFVDLGNSFNVIDATGEPPLSKLISHVSNNNPGIVTCIEDVRHGLETGDHVIFEEVEGMIELNSAVSRPVKVINPYSFTIEDTTNYGSYECGGRFRQKKLPKLIEFQPLVTQISHPSILMSADMSKFDHDLQIHCFVQALSLFRTENGRFPAPGEENVILELTKKVAASSSQNPGIKDNLILFLARGAGANIAPMTAFLGGIVGQEAMKAVSGKFTPITQFFYMDAVESLPFSDSLPPVDTFTPVGSRYDDYIAVFGREVQEKVQNLSMFLVGAGAIGCEMLKNWALMGVGSKNPIFITDMDTIERSNLSRQFLFRNTDVGQLKSLAAGKAITKMNPSTKVVAHSNRVAPETQNVYNDEFWENLDGVCTALDNVQARLYVDSRCVYYQKPLFESGTLGTKGNTQVVIPFLTESYGSTQDPPEQSIPICTLKNFPYQIEHTIQWARDALEGWFTQGPVESNNYLTVSTYLPELAKQPNSQLESLKTVASYLIDEKPTNFVGCVRWARLKFEEEYGNKIRQLLHNFPSDSVSPQGVKFWSGTKRCPIPLNMDMKDHVIMDFIISAANLHAFNYAIEGSRNVEMIESILNDFYVPEFKPVTGVKIAADEAEMKKEAESKDSLGDLEPQINELISRLPAPNSSLCLKPVEFEKDDDSNFHMDFITACSNLRARNYRIKEENRHETKLIAGKIIPAIATTTALVTGLIVLEIYKYVQRKKLEDYRCCFANLALSIFSFSEPVAPQKKKAPLKDKEWEWSLWDRIDIDASSMTMADFIEYFNSKYGLTINMVSYGSAILYSFFGNKKNMAERMPMKVREVCEKVSKTEIDQNVKYIIMEACVNDDDDNDVEIPFLRVKIA